MWQLRRVSIHHTLNALKAHHTLPTHMSNELGKSDYTIVLPCFIMTLVISTSALSATTWWNHSTPTQTRKWRLDGLMAAQCILRAWQVVHFSWILYEDLKEEIYTMTMIRHMSCNNPSAYFNKVAESLHLLLIYLDVSQASYNQSNLLT